MSNSSFCCGGELSKHFDINDPFTLWAFFNEDEKRWQKLATDYTKAKLLPRTYVDLKVFLRESSEIFGEILNRSRQPSTTTVGLIAHAFAYADLRYSEAFQNTVTATTLLREQRSHDKDYAALVDEILCGKIIVKVVHLQGHNDCVLRRDGDTCSLTAFHESNDDDLIADIFLLCLQNKEKGIKEAVLVKKNEIQICLAKNSLTVQNLKFPMSRILNLKAKDEATETFGLLWSALGSAHFCFKKSLDYTLNRKQFGRPIAQTQLIQLKLANMVSEIGAGCVALYHTGIELDNNKTGDCQDIANIAKMLQKSLMAKCLSISRDARDTMGANGILVENQVMRHLSNLEYLQARCT